MNHKEMDVWLKSMDLVEETYRLSNEFPKEEKFGLISQIRRAAVSIPSNIAEGAARKSDKEFVQFLSVVLGSTAEVDTHYQLAIRLNFIRESRTFENLLISVIKLLIGTRNYLMKKRL